MKNEVRLLCFVWLVRFHFVSVSLHLRRGKKKFHFFVIAIADEGMGQNLGLHRYCNDMEVIYIIMLSNAIIIPCNFKSFKPIKSNRCMLKHVGVGLIELLTTEQIAERIMTI